MKRKIHSPFIDNIWGADLANMQLIFKVNKEFRFSLCVMDIYSRYARAIPMKEKKYITNIILFRRFLMNQIANQIKYGLMRVMDFQRIMKENPLLLKDSLELQKKN